MRKNTKSLRTLFVVGMIAISLGGCALNNPEQAIGDNPAMGIGTHNLRLPTLGPELRAAFAQREKTWVSRIYIHEAPIKDQRLWESTALLRHRTGVFTNYYTRHKASYFLSHGMKDNLRHDLGLYYHISPNSDVEVDVKLSVEQSGKHEDVLVAGKFMDVSSKFSLRLTESIGRKTISDKIFTGIEREHLYLTIRSAMFPRTHEAEKMLEKAYRKMWRDLLTATVN